MLRSARAWSCAITSVRGGSPKRWANRRCARRYSSTGTWRLIGDAADDLARLRLEDGEQPGLLREPRDPDRLARLGSPAERARHEDVDVARTVELHRALDLVLEVVQVGDRRRRDVRDLVRHRDERGVLALPEDVARARPRPAWCWRCAPPAAWRSSAARRCSCTPRCRSRRRARRRCARTSRRGSRNRCRGCRRRRPVRRRGCRSGP